MAKKSWKGVLPFEGFFLSFIIPETLLMMEKKKLATNSSIATRGVITYLLQRCTKYETAEVSLDQQNQGMDVTFA